MDSVAALSIKNEGACCLVRELAERRGESMTAVVTEAVREKLERERKSQINEARMQYWLDFGQRVRDATPPELLDLDLFDDMYDETGLPKQALVCVCRKGWQFNAGAQHQE